MKKFIVQTKAPKTTMFQPVLIDVLTLNLNDAVENSDFVILSWVVGLVALFLNE